MRNGISPYAWQHFLALNGSNTGGSEGLVSVPPGVDYMDIVQVSVAGWRDAASSSNGTLLTDNWPYPNDRAAAWMAVAKEIMQVGECDRRAGQNYISIVSL